MRLCELRNLDLVTYENGMQMQQELVTLRQEERIPDQLLLLQHPPVITLGRSGHEENLLASPAALAAEGVRFYETTRGGDITYHGPGQLVGYPLISLGEGRRDVRRYVTNLEEVIIRTVAAFGIEAGRWEGHRGVWVGREKIAAIGVRVAKWVTSHGFALNVDPNLHHFDLITPCGIPDAGVTSIARLTGRSITVEEVREALVPHFADVFEREIRPNPPDLALVKVVVHDGNRILLLHRRPDSGDFWQPITGRIEAGEVAEAAARREIVEETGMGGEPESLDLRQSFLIEAKYLKDASDLPIFADEIAFAAWIDASRALRLDASEHDRYGWFSTEEALAKIRWSDDREAIERLVVRALSASAVG
ncbi:MAG: lipoyl(octanoyl) transferase LipB [Thermoanaerobaculia bacterium]